MFSILVGAAVLGVLMGLAITVAHLVIISLEVVGQYLAQLFTKITEPSIGVIDLNSFADRNPECAKQIKETLGTMKGVPLESLYSYNNPQLALGLDQDSEIKSASLMYSSKRDNAYSAFTRDDCGFIVNNA